MADTFGQKLKRWREKAHVSQAELARRMNVSPTWVSNLERDFSPSAKGGKPQPSIETCDKIARALGVKIAEVRLAAGYAPPGEPESWPHGQSDQTKEREAQAARNAEMIENFSLLSPARQSQALALIKVLREEHPETLQILGSSFHVQTTEEIDLNEKQIKETPKSKR